MFGPNPDGWLFPVTRLDELLPHWVQFGGQFRDGAEGQTGLSYASVDDGYDLTQLRLGIYLQPSKWLELVGVTQDSAGLLQQARKGGTSLSKHLGHSGGVCADRQFERRLGRSCGRTANVQLWGRARHRAIRLEQHGPSASVIFEGNNIYGIYSSFAHVVPQATLEPYVLWRVAPGSVALPETAGHGHLSEVTGGARLSGTLLANFDYDIEVNKQAGSLRLYSIDAWAGHWNAGYTSKNARTRPRPFVEYNYASGNRKTNGNRWGTHDQIYASAHDKIDFAD